MSIDGVTNQGKFHAVIQTHENGDHTRLIDLIEVIGQSCLTDKCMRIHKNDFMPIVSLSWEMFEQNFITLDTLCRFVNVVIPFLFKEWIPPTQGNNGEVIAIAFSDKTVSYQRFVIEFLSPYLFRKMKTADGDHQSLGFSKFRSEDFKNFIQLAYRQIKLEELMAPEVFNCVKIATHFQVFSLQETLYCQIPFLFGNGNISSFLDLFEDISIPFEYEIEVVKCVVYSLESNARVYEQSKKMVVVTKEESVYVFYPVVGYVLEKWGKKFLDKYFAGIHVKGKNFLLKNYFDLELKGDSFERLKGEIEAGDGNNFRVLIYAYRADNFEVLNSYMTFCKFASLFQSAVRKGIFQTEEIDELSQEILSCPIRGRRACEMIPEYREKLNDLILRCKNEGETQKLLYVNSGSLFVYSKYFRKVLSGNWKLEKMEVGSKIYPCLDFSTHQFAALSLVLSAGFENSWNLIKEIPIEIIIDAACILDKYFYDWGIIIEKFIEKVSGSDIITFNSLNHLLERVCGPQFPESIGNEIRWIAAKVYLDYKKISYFFDNSTKTIVLEPKAMDIFGDLSIGDLKRMNLKRFIKGIGARENKLWMLPITKTWGPLVCHQIRTLYLSFEKILPDSIYFEGCCFPNLERIDMVCDATSDWYILKQALIPFFTNYPKLKEITIKLGKNENRFATDKIIIPAGYEQDLLETRTIFNMIELSKIKFVKSESFLFEHRLNFRDKFFTPSLIKSLENTQNLDVVDSVIQVLTKLNLNLLLKNESPEELYSLFRIVKKRYKTLSGEQVEVARQVLKSIATNIFIRNLDCNFFSSENCNNLIEIGFKGIGKGLFFPEDVLRCLSPTFNRIIFELRKEKTKKINLSFLDKEVLSSWLINDFQNISISDLGCAINGDVMVKLFDRKCSITRSDDAPKSSKIGIKALNHLSSIRVAPRRLWRDVESEIIKMFAEQRIHSSSSSGGGSEKKFISVNRDEIRFFCKEFYLIKKLKKHCDGIKYLGDKKSSENKQILFKDILKTPSQHIQDFENSLSRNGQSRLIKVKDCLSFLFCYFSAEQLSDWNQHIPKLFSLMVQAYLKYPDFYEDFCDLSVMLRDKVDLLSHLYNEVGSTMISCQGGKTLICNGKILVFFCNYFKALIPYTSTFNLSEYHKEELRLLFRLFCASRVKESPQVSFDDALNVVKICRENGPLYSVGQVHYRYIRERLGLDSAETITKEIIRKIDASPELFDDIEKKENHPLMIDQKVFNAIPEMPKKVKPDDLYRIQDLRHGIVGKWIDMYANTLSVSSSEFDDLFLMGTQSNEMIGKIRTVSLYWDLKIPFGRRYLGSKAVSFNWVTAFSSLERIELKIFNINFSNFKKSFIDPLKKIIKSNRPIEIHCFFEEFVLLDEDYQDFIELKNLPLKFVFSLENKIEICTESPKKWDLLIDEWKKKPFLGVMIKENRHSYTYSNLIQLNLCTKYPS